MPGNRALFDRAMEQSREAARQKQWDESLKQVVRALQEFPQDADARSSAAVALFHTNKLSQSLQLFEDLHKSDKHNPFFLEYIAHIHDQTGNVDAAVRAYSQVAELQQSRRLNMRAVEALREVLRLRPDADDQRLRMARLFEEMGSSVEAAATYIELARRQKSPEEGLDYAETALRLDPSSRESKELITGFSERLASAAIAPTPAPDDHIPAPAIFGATGGLRGQQLAGDRLVTLAQERQEAGDIDGAIQQYERAISMGTEKSEAYYSLGLLYQDRGDHERAVQLLPRAAADEEYALSAHYMLGQSYQALNQLPQAAAEYEQTIRLLPLETIGKAESEDMIQMYESAAQIYIELNDIARAASLYSTLSSFLQSKRWGRERSDEFRQKAKELTERNMFAKLRTMGTGILTPPAAQIDDHDDGEPMPETWGKIRPITDFLRRENLPLESDDIFAAPQEEILAPAGMSDFDELAVAERPMFAPFTTLTTAGLPELAERYVLASEKYAEQGLTLAAIDACMEVIRIDVEYLPIHLRLGEIYERENRRDEALTKYQLLIDTYAARGEARNSIDVFYRLIDLSPDTTNVRTRLAELLRAEGRTQDAAEQIGQVAGSYFRLGQSNKALEEYRRGVQWAPNNVSLHSQYGMALLKLERYEAALSEFRKALELEQNNPVHVAHMNMTLAMMGDQVEAVWQSLATLLEQLKTQPETQNNVQAEYRAALLIMDEPILHYILGIIQQLASQHQSALLEFEQAAQLLEDDPDQNIPTVLVYQAAANSHIALGQADAAREQLQKSMGSSTPAARSVQSRYAFATPLSQGDIVRRMAEAYAATGDMEGAEQALQQAKQHLPYDRAIYTKLADIYFQQGRLSEALNQMDELASHYEKRQDLDKAIEALDVGVQLAPNNIPVGSRLARLYVRRGYLDKGVEHMVRVAELQRKAGQLKDAVASLQQVAEIYATLGQQDDARMIYDKIVQIMPNDIETRQWLAIMHTLAFRTNEAIAEKKQLVRIYLQQRDLEGATEELFTIIALDQNDVEAQSQLGDVLMRREEYEQALRIYGRLAKMPGVDADRVDALIAAARRMLDQQQAQRKA